MRKKNAPRGRFISINTDEMIRMDTAGLEWQKKHDSYKQDLHIVNNGLNLYGEYYDLGYDKTVIILSGRTESLRYGYYFAKPYSDFGMNVLVIDSRTHGLSDGKYITVGFEEGMDALAWAKYLDENFNPGTIIFHGICIGAASGMFAITAPDCPECVKGIVTEGMFPKFAESMKNHLIERKRLMFPVMQCINFWFRLHTGHTLYKGPIDVIPKMDKALLMLQSRMDKYSKVNFAEKMFALSPSKNKKLVLFDTGDHSMLRYTHTEKYDFEITEFLSKVFSQN